MSNPGLNAIYNGAFAQGLNLTNSVGFGRRRRAYHHHDHHHDHMHHRRHGRGIMDFIRKGNAILKDKKLISKGLDSLKGMAERNGYGRRRRRVRHHAGARKRRHGGARVIKIVIAPKRGRGRRTHRRRHY